jgi:hypothetical protein
MRVIDAVNFIRSNNILNSWTNEQIALGIVTALKESAITWTVDENNNLTGIVFGRWENDATSFHVVAIAGKNSPKTFFRYLRRVFPSCKRITGFRKEDQFLKEFNLV